MKIVHKLLCTFLYPLHKQVLHDHAINRSTNVIILVTVYKMIADLAAYFAVHKIISFQTFSILLILFLGFCENSESQTGLLVKI